MSAVIGGMGAVKVDLQFTGVVSNCSHFLSPRKSDLCTGLMSTQKKVLTSI